jgi:rhodanese-related sulfurtransferase
MKIPVLVIVFLCNYNVITSGQISDTLRYKSLEPYDFHLQYLRTDSALLIDVREFFEFKRVRIKGAINIPSSGEIESASDTLNRNFALFLYCSTDYRSRRVADILSKKGFKKLYNLEGGIVAWKKDGMPVEKRRPVHGSRYKARKRVMSVE